ncbi:DNA methyltransferase [Propionivibrio sp.]|uniref:DNA methyltransferase n=1 Tax=Propionivibrio sp. TaxID=2212460 RepID=UPI0025CF9211|nr:DNA methyltransferase [Propionivibrio sp.]MBK7356346.1 site-specific DNA-methyltransferase [Propionivibrio sp.]
MSANSVDAIITDPPYFRVKGEAWDNQWDTPTEFLAWVGLLCEQFERIMKPNGSLYFFASPKMAARVECEIGKRFAVLSSITWRKGAESKSSVGWSQKTEKEALRLWLPTTERIIFAEHYGADNMAKGEAGYEAKCDELRGFIFEPLRTYLAEEVKRAGWTPGRLNEAMGFAPRGMAETRYFGRSQWQLPTEPHYAKMRGILVPAARVRRPAARVRRPAARVRRPAAPVQRDGARPVVGCLGL